MLASGASCRFRIHRVFVTESTNADVSTLARAQEPDGFVLVAGHQRAGRGRLDRVWEAPPDVNLLMSVLLRPKLPLDRRHLVPTAVAVAAVEACQSLGMDASLKWPNDLVVGDEKLAGLLSESVLARPGEGADAVVVGLGCNVGWPAAGEMVGATSLAAHGISVTPDELCDEILARVDETAPDLLVRYRRQCSTIGRDVRVELPDGTAVEGRAVNVDDDGLLVVEVPISEVSPSDANGPRFLTRRYGVGDIVHLRSA